MKVVLDTNVWVSALAFPGGTCDQLLQYFIRHPAVEIITSPFILHEFERVIREKIGLSPTSHGPVTISLNFLSDFLALLLGDKPMTKAMWIFWSSLSRDETF